MENLVICKPRTLKWQQIKTQFNTENVKKHCFLAAAILLFMGKI